MKLRLAAAAMYVFLASAPIFAQQDAASQTPSTATHFQQTVTNSTCELALACKVTFPAVTRGFRLVITQFNGSNVSTPTNSESLLYATLSGGSNRTVETFPYTGPVVGGVNSIANQSTLVYFDAGAKPTVTVNSPTGLSTVNVSLSGYLEPAP